MGQTNADMDSTLEAMKMNVDKLLELFKDASEKMKDNNNRLIQGTLMVFCDITRELSQKIKDATEMGNGKSPREFFTQPQVKSALKLFSDQLDWINKLLEDYMKENKVATESKASIQETNKRKSWFNGNGNGNDSLKPQVQLRRGSNRGNKIEEPVKRKSWFGGE